MEVVSTSLPSEVDPLALEQQVCFALAVTNRAVLAVYRPLLEPLGLTHPQYPVMLTLWDHHRAGRRLGPSVDRQGHRRRATDGLRNPFTDAQATRLARLDHAVSQRPRRARHYRRTGASGYPAAPPRVEDPARRVERLGVGVGELNLLRDLLTRVNTATLAPGALDD